MTFLTCLLLTDIVGGHGTLIVDIITSSLLRYSERRGAGAGGCRLNTKTSRISRYGSILERHIDIHCINNRIDEIVSVIVDNIPTPA